MKPLRSIRSSEIATLKLALPLCSAPKTINRLPSSFLHAKERSFIAPGSRSTIALIKFTPLISVADLISSDFKPLAFSAINNNDKVGVIFFTDKVEQFIPPKKGKSHILRIIREVLAFEPTGKGTDISGALEYFSAVIKKRSICFILSDFMCQEFERPLKIASKKHDLVALRIHDKREDILPNVGLVPLQDAESEQMIFVDTSSKKIQKNFAKTRLAKTEALKKLLPASGVDLIDITTGTDYVKPLINFFKTRGRRR